MITRNTTIDEIYSLGLISEETHDILRYSLRLVTLNDLSPLSIQSLNQTLRFSLNSDLKRISGKNFVSTSLEKLTIVRRAYWEKEVEKQFYMLPVRIRARMYKLSELSNVLDVIYSGDVLDSFDIKCGKEAIIPYLSFLASIKSLCKDVILSKSRLDANLSIKNKRLFDKKRQYKIGDSFINLDEIPTQALEDIQNELNCRFDRMSTRCKHSLNEYRDVRILCELIYNGKVESVYSLRNIGKKSLSEFSQMVSSFKPYFEETIKPFLTAQYSNTDREQLISIFSKLPEDIKSSLQEELNSRFDNLSMRCKNYLYQYRDINELLHLVCSSRCFDIKKVRNCGKKTEEEFYSFLNCFISHFKEIIVKVQLDNSLVDTMRLTKIESQYPFLLTKECQTVLDVELEQGELPFLFILIRYLKRADSRDVVICRSLLGLNEDGKSLTLSDLAEMMNLTRERVRQIAAKVLKLPKYLSQLRDKFINQFQRQLISKNDDIWNDILKRNCVSLSVEQLMKLICSVDSSFVFFEVDGKDMQYIIKKDFVQNLSLRRINDRIKSVLNKRRVDAEIVNIESIVYDDASTISQSEKDIVCPIFMEYVLSSNPACQSLDKKHFVVDVKNLDKSVVVENILSHRKSPMTLIEIMDEFISLYPDEEVTTPMAFRSHLWKNSNIISIGKSGYYALASWKDVYTGSITDYLYYILTLFDEPLHLKDIYELAKAQFPKTTIRSVQSLMSLDAKQRFKSFDNNLYGLVEKDYSHCDVREREEIKRQSPGERLDEFEQFVISHKRFPASSGSDLEESLNRWGRLVSNRKVNMSQEQYDRFFSLFKTYSDYPSTGDELNFKRMCDSIKIIVSKTFMMPTKEEDTTEYMWFKKNLDSYWDYLDNRKMYFEDLLMFLRDYGFYY